MKKWALGIISIIVICFAVRAYAEYELQTETLNLVTNTGSVQLRHGHFCVTNSVSINGDTIQTNSFIPDSPPSTEITSSSGVIFSGLINKLIEDNSVNVNTFVNDTTGQQQVYLPGQDTTITDLNGT